jgi:hypothetical protein
MLTRPSSRSCYQSRDACLLGHSNGTCLMFGKLQARDGQAEVPKSQSQARGDWCCWGACRLLQRYHSSLKQRVVIL